MTHSLEQNDQQKDRVDKDESQEVLVITITEAVVDKWAMMVKQLNAPVADRAVERCFAFDDLAARAKVVKVQPDL